MSYYKSTIERRKTGLIYRDNDWSSGCYTLYAPQTGNGLVKLIDITGETIHEWNMPVRPGRHAVLLPNGNLGYNGSHEKSVDLYPYWDLWHGGHFIEARPNGDIVWEHEDIYHHHDGQWLENGNLLYTVATPIPIRHGWPHLFNPEVPLEMQQRPISDTVREVNREGEVVWEWNAWEHLSIKDYPIHECFNSDNAKERLHWPMINGVYQDGFLIYLSLRTTSGIIAVNKNTKEVIWELKYPLVAQQHDPSITEDGNLLCFDNGNLRPNTSTTHSRIVEYDTRTKELVESYVDPNPATFFTPYMGSVQKLWNGSYSICESAFGRIFEVNPEGELMWEYVIPEFGEYPEPLNEFITGEHNSCFKAHRYNMLPPELNRFISFFDSE